MLYAMADVPVAGAPEKNGRPRIQTEQSEERIRGLVSAVRRCGGEAAVDEAVKGICRLLWAEFPGTVYGASLSPWNLKASLLTAVDKGKPLIVAFTPKDLTREEVFRCTTYFVEVVGIGAKIDSMFPNIRTANNGLWRAPGDALREPLDIRPFGRAQHQWQCALRPWRGGVLTLSYLGYYGAEKKRLGVQCCARLP